MAVIVAGSIEITETYLSNAVVDSNFTVTKESSISSEPKSTSTTQNTDMFSFYYKEATGTLSLIPQHECEEVDRVSTDYGYDEVTYTCKNCKDTYTDYELDEAPDGDAAA